MATPSASIGSTLLPQSQPLSTRTPTSSEPTSAAIMPSLTPNNTNSQDQTQSLYSSFLPSSLESQDLAVPQLQKFPPASTFTFIPDLYNLITRLRLLEGTPQFRGQGSGIRTATSSPLLNRDTGIVSKSDPADLSNTDGVQATDFQTTDNLTHEAAAEKTNGSKPTESTTSQTLEIKDLPENMYEIKQAIQNARQVVAALPDIHRTIGEQQVEIDQLQRLVEGLKKRVGELAVLAVAQPAIEKHEDTVMEGVEAG